MSEYERTGERMLYLVRHAEVTVDPTREAHEWKLSTDGIAAARKLAGASSWRGLAAVASSPEPKAQETARPIAAAAGLPVALEPNLREAHRTATWAVGEARYVALVRSYFASPSQPPEGWEAARHARRRVIACIERLLDEADRSVCVVSHGLVLSLYVAALTGRPAPTVEEWRAIPLPGVAVVDPASRQVVSPFVSVDGFLDWEGSR